MSQATCGLGGGWVGGQKTCLKAVPSLRTTFPSRSRPPHPPPPPQALWGSSRPPPSRPQPEKCAAMQIYAPAVVWSPGRKGEGPHPPPHPREAMPTPPLCGHISALPAIFSSDGKRPKQHEKGGGADQMPLPAWNWREGGGSSIPPPISLFLFVPRASRIYAWPCRNIGEEEGAKASAPPPLQLPLPKSAQTCSRPLPHTHIHASTPPPPPERLPA